MEQGRARHLIVPGPRSQWPRCSKSLHCFRRPLITASATVWHSVAPHAGRLVGRRAGGVNLLNLNFVELLVVPTHSVSRGPRITNSIVNEESLPVFPTIK